MDPRSGGMPTFERAAEKVIALHAKNWKGDASEKQWRQCLRDYVFPKLGRKRVGEITTADVLACLAPIWNEKRPTAARVRRRIGAVMKWAVARGYREDNPAGDAIAAALPGGTRHRTHFRALPHGEVGTALEAVRESDAWLGIRLCLEFVALTATRSGEARRARWPEIDRDRATWTVPAERMKTGREHRVPLSTGALAVLEEARAIENGSGLIFPSFKGRELRSPQVAGAFRDLGIPSTVHGLRSSFRDWAAETGVERTVAEAALAHKVGGVEGAYFRSDLFERRREVMQDWSAYLAAGRARRRELIRRRDRARRPSSGRSGGISGLLRAPGSPQSDDRRPPRGKGRAKTRPGTAQRAGSAQRGGAGSAFRIAGVALHGRRAEVMQAWSEHLG